MITIPLHWWYLPVALALVGLFFFWLGGRQRGMLGGAFECLFGLALLIGAATSFVTGWWAS